MKTCFLTSAVILTLATGAVGKPNPKEIALTAVGATLHATCSSTLAGLQKQITAKLPTINPQQQAAFLAAHEVGKGTVTFNRTVTDDFIKEGYRYAGPQFGGITPRALPHRPGAL